MITIYGMPSCPDCSYLDDQIEGNAEFNYVDISVSPKNLKAFLKIRDTNELFAPVIENGSIGIPCFVREDGSVTIIPEEVGLKSRPVEEEAASCCAGGSC